MEERPQTYSQTLNYFPAKMIVHLSANYRITSASSANFNCNSLARSLIFQKQQLKREKKSLRCQNHYSLMCKRTKDKLFCQDSAHKRHWLFHFKLLC